jgi:hypothetical protein
MPLAAAALIGCGAVPDLIASTIGFGMAFSPGFLSQSLLRSRTSILRAGCKATTDRGRIQFFTDGKDRWNTVEI